MALQHKNILITGASMGIGESIAVKAAAAGAKLVLFARSEDKLKEVVAKVKSNTPSASVTHLPVDIQDYQSVKKAVEESIQKTGPIDVLINNAGLALGAPARFDRLPIEQILQMNQTNVNGTMFATYAVLNACMAEQDSGTILNVSSTTALEPPPFPGEAVYHANKACIEGFTNSLRNELCGTNIRVLALRPGVVATHFHHQRVGFDQKAYDEFTKGFEPLHPDEVADAAVFQLSQPPKISVKALDIIPSAVVDGLRPRLELKGTLMISTFTTKKQQGHEGETQNPLSRTLSRAACCHGSGEVGACRDVYAFRDSRVLVYLFPSSRDLAQNTTDKMASPASQAMPWHYVEDVPPAFQAQPMLVRPFCLECVRAYGATFGSPESMPAVNRCDHSALKWPCTRCKKSGTRCSGDEIPAPLHRATNILYHMRDIVEYARGGTIDERSKRLQRFYEYAEKVTAAINHYERRRDQFVEKYGHTALLHEDRRDLKLYLHNWERAMMGLGEIGDTKPINIVVDAELEKRWLKVASDDDRRSCYYGTGSSLPFQPRDQEMT